MRRNYWERRIRSLDRDADWHEIARITVGIEFPWDVSQALSLALLRSYAVPSIGGLLTGTGALTGPEALHRISRVHGHDPISDDDLRYVLSTFVVVPQRWIEDFGWRPLWLQEERALVRYYRELGLHLGIQDVPQTYEEFEDLMDSYEQANFAYDPGARAAADETLELAATLPMNHRLPPRVVSTATLALLDDHVLDAFHYERPSRLLRATVRGALKTRREVVARMRPRTEPVTVMDLPQVGTSPER